MAKRAHDQYIPLPGNVSSAEELANFKQAKVLAMTERGYRYDGDRLHRGRLCMRFVVIAVSPRPSNVKANTPVRARKRRPKSAGRGLV